MMINCLLIYLIILFANLDKDLTFSLKINKSNAQSLLNNKTDQNVR